MKDPSRLQQAELCSSSGRGGVMIGKSTMGPRSGSVLLWQSVAGRSSARNNLNAGSVASGLALLS